MEAVDYIQEGMTISMKRRKWTTGLIATVMVASLTSSVLAATVPGAVYGDNRPPVAIEKVIEKLQASGVTQKAAEKIATHWAGASVTALADIGVANDLIKVDVATGEVKLDGDVDQTTSMSVFAKVLGIANKSDTKEVAAKKAEDAGLAPAPTADKPMSRRDVAKMIGKALGVTPVRFVTAENYPFNDFGSVDLEDAALLMALYELGIFKGFEDRTFRPDGILTVAQIALLIDRVLGLPQ